MTKQDVLTVEQIAEIFHIHKNTLQRKKWRERTGFPLRKVGKRLFGLTAEVDKWARGQ